MHYRYVPSDFEYVRGNFGHLHGDFGHRAGLFYLMGRREGELCKTTFLANKHIVKSPLQMVFPQQIPPVPKGRAALLQ
jgi:hypothetical protein